MIKPGKIVIDTDINVQPHELKTADALANAGYTIRFIRRSEEKRAKSADALINNKIWEFKSPTSDKLNVVEKNIRKALHQSSNVVFDSRRMKRLPNSAIEREVRKWSKALNSLSALLYINKQGAVIGIKP